MKGKIILFALLFFFGLYLFLKVKKWLLFKAIEKREKKQKKGHK